MMCRSLRASERVERGVDSHDDDGHRGVAVAAMTTSHTLCSSRGRHRQAGGGSLGIGPYPALGKIERDMRALLTPAGACVFTINFVIPIIMLVAFVAMTTVQRAGAGRQDGAGGATGAADDV